MYRNVGDFYFDVRHNSDDVMFCGAIKKIVNPGGNKPLATRGFLMFLGSMKRDQCDEMG